MTNITKEALEELLNAINENVKNATEDDYSDSEWYREILWRDELEDYFEDCDYEAIMNIEDRLAIDAVQYPDLYPVIREIIEGITKINNEYWSGPIDVDSEWSAGTFFAGRLALASKSDEDVLLFAEHLATRDIDHEAEPFDFFGVWEILKEFGYCDKTVPVIIALFSANSQHRGDHITVEGAKKFTAYLNEGDNLNRFLAEMAKWNKEYNVQLEELFYLLLDEALGLGEDQGEEAEELFTQITDEGRIPTKDDFKTITEG
ncbi:MAG: hypothetical protein E6767_12195 [Dysgonomonas sp.]|nr:hypothetical protein [Dysgonomonas sp.]